MYEKSSGQDLEEFYSTMETAIGKAEARVAEFSLGNIVQFNSILSRETGKKWGNKLHMAVPRGGFTFMPPLLIPAMHYPFLNVKGRFDCALVTLMHNLCVSVLTFGESPLNFLQKMVKQPP